MNQIELAASRSTDMTALNFATAENVVSCWAVSTPLCGDPQMWCMAVFGGFFNAKGENAPPKGETRPDMSLSDLLALR
ncbi:hypothetical protein [Amycolatopsis sp. lyj-346]|uniref:hypothetical protein n=1 Tax=Amycolatopsis sp. lyj-346 TaxID=2789289 RepID=UPI00397D1632